MAKRIVNAGLQPSWLTFTLCEQGLAFKPFSLSLMKEIGKRAQILLWPIDVELIFNAYVAKF
ncbi:hypothetical protein XEUV354_23360 [Xanthomonas euvesicatoria]|uniref:Uncharacterized protein n=2 Tax=Xanthomonas TaxID=338 RepID=A0AAX0I5K2_XANCG|nr:hypothetical protein BGK55_12265 [Xanthomonas citri pv. malvacearum]AOY63315.1 hypothetical protein BHE84_14890 [Xanthomonas citri pv. glycines str. 8ra]APO90880.1 hypothetical protein BJD11_13260 [Xanthomonas euvesicatoria]ARV22867.1 hypothetical protein A9D66_09725 [Xanthomonas citri pv. glycines str. 12-2]EKQ58563.1 hypothetical protein MOU_21110 [Xanthomonas citri pv. malvacearum str. GSPB1386]OEY98735.1 hypothetical protein BIY41_10295 [Xanthomonas citri pv. glycines]OOW81344.1 hypoth